MERVVKELARQAAAAARAERDVAAAARTEREAAAEQVQLPVRDYRGVRERNGRYAAEVRIPAENSRRVWLGVYETAEEAAHAYDAAARNVQGHRAKTNFPEPSAAPREAAAVEGGDVAAAAALTHLAQVAAPTPPRASFFHWAAPPAAAPAAAPRLPAVPYTHAPAQYFSQYFYQPDRPVAGAAYGAAFRTGSTMLGTYVAPVANRPASSAQSTTLKSCVSASQSQSPSRPASPECRGAPKPPTVESDQSMVGDNFTDTVASSSAAARPVPPLETGRGGAGAL